MYIQLVVSIVFILITVGFIVDRILTKMASSNITLFAESSWLLIDAIQPRNFIRSLSNTFAHIFDFVYGSRVFSVRRMIGSFISTLCAMMIIIMLAGPENTLVGNSSFDIVEIGIIALFLNFVVDYFSLAETRLVLRWVATARIPVFILEIADVVLTLSIFFVGWCALYIFHPAFSKPTEDIWSFFSRTLIQFIEYGFDIETAGIFTYTTFFTSVTWFLYIFTAAIVRFAFALSYITKPFLLQLAETKRPVQMIMASLSILIIFASVFTWLVGLSVGLISN